jgi:hypothetical protein
MSKVLASAPLLDGMYRVIWTMKKLRPIEVAYDDTFAKARPG